MDKRGISPLIATVLIIGFTIVLAAVIFVWGNDFIKGSLQKVDASEEKLSTCAATTIKLTNINQTAPNKLKFTLENTGDSDIESIIIRIIGDKGTASVTNSTGAKIAEAKAYESEFNPDQVGTASSIEILPTINIKNQPATCTGIKAPVSSG